MSQLNNGTFKKDKDDEMIPKSPKGDKGSISNYFDMKYATVEKLLKT